MRYLVALALIPLVAFGCGDGDVDTDNLAEDTETASSTEAGVRSTTTQATRAAATATATPERTEFSLGEQVETRSGNFVTVYSYEAPVSSDNQFSQPDPGNVFALIDVEGCAGATNTQAVSLNPFDFELQMLDNTRRQSDIPVREPSLHATDLAGGDCVRGFVTFEVPDGQNAKAVVFTSSGIQGSTIIKWAVPQSPA
jgi:Domain of unknown function (DUF4352)